MVNYCCVYGCGRNSRLNKHLNYYGLPKEINRQVEWLKAAGREDLLQKGQEKVTGSHRFCSRHFPPNSIKNRNLRPDAVPTLCLPGQWSEGESEEDPLPHNDIYCNNCKNPIVGFRYKCVTCKDFDLCQKCEMMEAHPEHFMLRMPKPIKFTVADNLTDKWRRFFNVEHVTPECLETSVLLTDSSDDEPITKYAKNYDSGIDLSEDTKDKIKAEVTRVLKINHQDHKKSNKTVKRDRKRPAEDAEKMNKRPKLEDGDVNKTGVTDLPSAVPEVAFADVNEMDHMLDLKSEFPPSLMAAAAAEQASAVPEEQQPVMHVKLSDDLTELMIEVTSNHQKMVYKYAD